MAQITGSSTIDWSSISLAQVDFETDIVTFVNRVDQIFTEFGNHQGTLVSGSPTRLVVDLFSGGRLTLGGSGFDTSPIINSFYFSNMDTGEVIRWAGTLDGIGTEIFTSAQIGSTNFVDTINGNIMFPATFPTSGNITATLTSLVVRIGTAKGTFSGNFSLTANLSSASLTGKVTGISVVSGTDTIKMTGLSLSINVIEAALASGDLATVNDLFSVVGNQLAGNDTITYTNNIPGTGMTFVGGAGNDTITVIGDNADTLVGGTGNDKLIGGLGQDSIMGELGNDQITMLVTAGNVDTIDAGDDTDTLVLSGVVPGDHVVVVDLSSSTDQVVSIGGVADAPTQINFENLTASGIGSSVDVTGSDGGNIIIGSNGNDSIDGGDGDDVLKGGGDDDVLTGGLGNDLLIGGTGNDTYTVDVASDVVTEGLAAGTDEVFASLTSTLGANVENLTLTGNDALNGTGNTLANVLTGNDGANVLTGGAGNDTLIGGLGEDTVTGGTENDRIVMLVTAGDVDVANGGAGLDTLALVGAVDGDGVVVVDLSSLTDQVTRIGTADPQVLVQKNFERLDASGLGISSSVNVTGSAGANLMIGSNGNDQLTGNAGNDTLNGGAGDDTLLSGGDGNDVILIGAAADHGGSEVIDGGAGTDVIRFTSTTSDETLVLNSNVTAVESVVIGTAAGLTTGTTALNVDASALNSGLSITGNAGDNVLTGTSVNDTLIGGAGNDTLLGGLGQDTVRGNAGNDTFLFGSGDGQDLVQDNSGSADKILFDSGINPLDLVISRHADNLRVAIHGSSDQITVQNWYTSSVNRTETIQAGNGDTLTSTQVNQLIQAMAGFTQDTGLSWDAASGGAGDPGQQAQFQGIIAANWQ
jgi:Ca2+-binding RTX toxin-like protein